MKKLLLLINILGVLTAASPAFAGGAPMPDGGPARMIVDAVDKCLAILKNPALQTPAIIPQRRQRLWELIEPVFAYEEIDKRVLNRYWTDLTLRQQTEFTTGFTEFMKSSYLDKTDDYNGENLEYMNELVEGDRAKVQANFITADGRKFPVGLSLTRENGSWKIYDAEVFGISVAGIYRVQFYDILERLTFEDLMQKIRGKTAAFAEAKI